MSLKYQKETKSLKFARIVREIMPYIFLALLGTIIWLLTYVILYFYKELLLCYIKRTIKFEGISYYEKLKEYKKNMSKFLIFNSIIVMFWLIILFTNEEWRFYIIKSGFIFFILIYIIGWTVYYKFYSYTNDFFDEFYFFVNYINKEYISKYNIFNSNKKEKKRIRSINIFI